VAGMLVPIGVLSRGGKQDLILVSRLVNAPLPDDRWSEPGTNVPVASLGPRLGPQRLHRVGTGGGLAKRSVDLRPHQPRQAPPVTIVEEATTRRSTRRDGAEAIRNDSQFRQVCRPFVGWGPPLHEIGASRCQERAFETV
jgi:hypothetical protein